MAEEFRGTVSLAFLRNPDAPRESFVGGLASKYLVRMAEQGIDVDLAELDVDRTKEGTTLREGD